MARPDRRRDLIDAGIELLDDLSFQAVLGAVDTARVAKRAGVTSGSFFHHFRSRAHYADAVAAQIVQRYRDDRAQRLAAMAEAIRTSVSGPGAALRDLTTSEWDRDSADRLTIPLVLLWSTRNQPTSDRTTRTPLGLLGATYQDVAAEVAARFPAMLRLIDREPLPPFSVADLEVVLTSLGLGLRYRSAITPEAVPQRLVEDIFSLLVITMSRPRADRRALDHLEAELTQPEPPPVDDTDPDRRWEAIVEAAVPLFDERHWSQVLPGEVATAAGVPPATLRQHFASVRVVAAATFTRHLPELRALSEEPLTQEEGPERRIEAVLVRMVELAAQNRGVTEAVVQQTLEERVRDGETVTPGSLRARLRLSELLAPHTRELRARGLLRRRVDSRGLAVTLVNLALLQVLVNPDAAPERIVDDTSDLILNGAIAQG